MAKTIINKEAMFVAFKHLGKNALSMNHFDLSVVCSEFDSDQWATFLALPEIQEHIDREMAIIRQSTKNKLIQDAGSSKSVGQAQLLNTLQKMDEDTIDDSGPTFIYCHVPLTPSQEHATNVLETDINGNFIT